MSLGQLPERGAASSGQERLLKWVSACPSDKRSSSLYRGVASPRSATESGIPLGPSFSVNLCKTPWQRTMVCELLLSLSPLPLDQTHLKSPSQNPRKLFSGCLFGPTNSYSRGGSSLPPQLGRLRSRCLPQSSWLRWTWYWWARVWSGEGGTCREGLKGTRRLSQQLSNFG